MGECLSIDSHGEQAPIASRHVLPDADVMNRLDPAPAIPPSQLRSAAQWIGPQFRQKVNAICALYRQAPKGSVVLSVDEKTGIQAI